ncbi:sugar-binding transcriptional regulator [Lactobacillus sp. DCY120]|uniref:Sugar-binding transcriptional regulator n=1 Tax=Bombilactobacillus apium TaxID=2675299 RepID=A0A850R1J5_9LACO|nr:sugar-binding domain-containing protein [Bombilactobacillus apium]NVY96230.1 sugar-binding transcriptional regulator [Bombilactobacillus apium]
MQNIEAESRLANIARDYYLSQMTLGEISQKYHLSRYLITKSLKEAVSNGIVQIQIKSPINRNLEMEAKFKAEFGLNQVYIIKDTDSFTDRSENLLEFAANVIQEQIKNTHFVAMTWGSTVSGIINHFQPQALDDLVFTPLMGNDLKYDSPSGSTPLTQKAAAKFGAHYYTLPAPLYVLDDHTRQQLEQEPALEVAFNALQQADYLFTGLGTAASFDSIPTWRAHKSVILAGVNPEKIAGILYGRPFDLQGQILNSKTDKALGASMATIFQIPRRVAVVRSKFKSTAFLAALRGQLITTAITSEGVANRVLQAQKLKSQF